MVELARLLFQVVMQYKKLEDAGTIRKYGWLVTGSQALDSESWGKYYPVFHKYHCKHLQLGIGLFPYLCRNKMSEGEFPVLLLIGLWIGVRIVNVI